MLFVGKVYKPVTVQCYIANCVSWAPRLTLLDLQIGWTYQTCSQNENCSFVGGLLY